MNLNDAKLLAERLMTDNGLIPHWTFRFDRAVRRFGCCYWRKRMITLSRVLTELNAAAEVRDTILHEIAHALVGPGHWHDKAWKAKAAEIGCIGNRCYDNRAVNTPSHKYEAQCLGCKKMYRTHRRRKVSCGLCSGGRFNPSYLLRWQPSFQV